MQKDQKPETLLTQTMTHKAYEEDQTIWAKNKIQIGKLCYEGNFKRDRKLVGYNRT